MQLLSDAVKTPERTPPQLIPIRISSGAAAMNGAPTALQPGKRSVGWPRRCAEKNAGANIPPRVIRRDAYAFSAWVLRPRNVTERFLNHIKQFHGLATRCDRSPDNVLAALKIVAVRVWLARYQSAPWPEARIAA